MNNKLIDFNGMSICQVYFMCKILLVVHFILYLDVHIVTLYLAFRSKRDYMQTDISKK